MRNIEIDNEATIVTWRRCTQCNAAQMEFQLREDGICQKCYTGNLEKENAELSNSVLEFSNSVIELTNTKTELENKVTELETQIEKMKNCHNCKHSFHNGGYEEKCSGCWKYESKKDFQTNKKTYLHWELAE